MRSERVSSRSALCIYRRRQLCATIKAYGLAALPAHFQRCHFRDFLGDTRLEVRTVFLCESFAARSGQSASRVFFSAFAFLRSTVFFDDFLADAVFAGFFFAVFFAFFFLAVFAMPILSTRLG